LPIRACLYLGGGVAAVSLAYLCWVIARALSGDTPVTGWSSLAALVTFFGGLIVLVLGVIGEYVWQIAAATRRRPNAIVEWVRLARDS